MKFEFRINGKFSCLLFKIIKVGSVSLGVFCEMYLKLPYPVEPMDNHPLQVQYCWTRLLNVIAECLKVCLFCLGKSFRSCNAHFFPLCRGKTNLYSGNIIIIRKVRFRLQPVQSRSSVSSSCYTYKMCSSRNNMEKLSFNIYETPNPMNFSRCILLSMLHK